MARVTPEHVDARKRSILEAAAEVFARKGTVAATMQEIAQQAGLSPGTIYLYYSNKADLIRAVCDGKTGGVQALFEEAARQADEPLAILELVAQSLAQGFREDGFTAEVILSLETTLAGARDPDDLGAQLCATSQAIAEQITGLVRLAQQRGEIDPAVDPRTLAFVLEAFALGLQQVHLQTRGALDPEASYRLVIEMLRRLRPVSPGGASFSLP